jgi:hypothetical protein
MEYLNWSEGVRRIEQGGRTLESQPWHCYHVE